MKKTPIYVREAVLQAGIRALGALVAARLEFAAHTVSGNPGC